jgi:hypothetical protein
MILPLKAQKALCSMALMLIGGLPNESFVFFHGLIASTVEEILSYFLVWGHPAAMSAQYVRYPPTALHPEVESSSPRHIFSRKILCIMY